MFWQQGHNPRPQQEHAFSEIGERGAPGSDDAKPTPSLALMTVTLVVLDEVQPIMIRLSKRCIKIMKNKILFFIHHFYKIVDATITFIFFN